MKRRTFIQTSGIAGLGAAMPWGGAYAKSNSAFLQERNSAGMLFPRPAHGAELSISPVGLAWLPCPDAAGYRVEIYDDSNQKIYAKTIDPDPVHIPDRVFPPGAYAWDVIALDRQGAGIARHGKQSYTISPGAAQLPWIEPRELLRRVPADHPRILYPKHRLEEIRASLSTTRANSWKRCLQAAKRALSKGVPEFPTYHKIEDEGVRRLEYQKYFGYIRGYIDGALMDLSLAYVMSQEDQYADAAKKILLEIASWPHDDADVTSVSAKWGDEIGLSYSKCVHIAYDWLYSSFTEDEKQKVFAMCKARAGQTYRRLLRNNYLTYPGGSHNGRLIAYLSDMSLAMAGETDEAERWLGYSLKALLTIYPHWGGVNGGWAEGVPYGLYYNKFYIPAFESLRELAGYDLWQRPFFNQIRYFFFYCTANHGECRPFGDGAESGGPGVNRGSGYPELMAFHAHRYNDPYIGWWVNQIPGYRNEQSGVLALVHEDKLPSKPPKPLPNARLFETVGWAGLHSDLTDPENDACLIFKSSPYGSVSHSHADQNAFAILKGGKALAIPSGYYGPSYGKPHHALWTRSTKANNCILVNGEGQIVRSPIGGAIVEFEDQPGYAYVAGDATATYTGKLKKWVRRILFLRPGVVLLLDEIEAPAAGNYQWMLHSFEEMTIQENQIISRRADAQLQVFLACRQGLTISQTDQFDTPYNHGIPEAYHRNRPNHWHAAAETKQKSTAARIAAVMLVANDKEEIKLQTTRSSDWLQVNAEGSYGTIAGGVSLHPSAPTPQEIQGSQPVKLWARDRDGRLFQV
ncbi:MAG: DUF4962 domain-containing protein [Candidatus Omnitrophica bacterium]|nr:DUF4962 domain-containing protein [Candidatus Omnitrophota bacterium]